MKAVAEAGLVLVKPEAALVEEAKRFFPRNLTAVVEAYETNYGLKDTQDMIDTFAALVKKWVDLVQEVDSEEKLEEVYWRELYSKIDPVRYGIE